MALARHNDYREGHEEKNGNAYTLTPPLLLNEANAIALQAEMNKPGFAGVGSITNTPAGCQMSFYTEVKPAAVADLDKSHAATDTWYSGRTHYD
jgi:hypothetical protein